MTAESIIKALRGALTLLDRPMVELKAADLLERLASENTEMRAAGEKILTHAAELECSWEDEVAKNEKLQAENTAMRGMVEAARAYSDLGSPANYYKLIVALQTLDQPKVKS